MGLLGKKETDPVCGMKVDPQAAKFTTTYEGKAYFFCSAGCKARFEQNPGKFLASGPVGM